MPMQSPLFYRLIISFHQLFASQAVPVPIPYHDTAAQDQAHCAPELEVPQEPHQQQLPRPSQPCVPVVQQPSPRSHRVGLHIRDHVPTGNTQSLGLLRSEASRSPAKSCRRRPPGCKGRLDLRACVVQWKYASFTPSQRHTCRRYICQAHPERHGLQAQRIHQAREEDTWETVINFQLVDVLLERRRQPVPHVHVRCIHIFSHQFLRVSEP